MNKRIKRLSKTYLLLWLLPGIWSVYSLVFNRPHDISLSTSIYACIATLFGPWATLAAKAANIPHAGAFFHPWFAIGLTFGILSTIFVSILATKKWIIVICIGLSIPLVLGWSFLGWGQMASCLR